MSYLPQGKAMSFMNFSAIVTVGKNDTANLNKTTQHTIKKIKDGK